MAWEAWISVSSSLQNAVRRGVDAAAPSGSLDLHSDRRLVVEQGDGSAGLGVPQGFPFMPVVKVTGNPVTYERLPDHIDVLVGMMAGKGSGLKEIGEQLYEEVIAVASGKQTKAEALNIGNFPALYTVGPVI